MKKKDIILSLVRPLQFNAKLKEEASVLREVVTSDKGQVLSSRTYWCRSKYQKK